MIIPRRGLTMIISAEMFVALSYSQKELSTSSKKSKNAEPFDNIKNLAKQLTREKVKNRMGPVLEYLNSTENTIVPITNLLVYGL